MARENERPSRDYSDGGERGSERRSFNKPSDDRGEKKIFNRRDKEGRPDSGERRSFGSDRREGGEKRSFGSDRREGGERRSFGGDRRESGRSGEGSFRRDDRRPAGGSGERTERRPFGAGNREGGDRKPYGNDRREGGDRKPFGSDRREGGERRSFGSDRREGGDRKPFGAGNREGGERRSFGGDRPDRREGSDRREGGERKSFNSDRKDFRREEGSFRRDDNRGEKRSFGTGNREGGERRSFGNDRPNRSEGGERRSFGGDRKEGGDKKPFGADRSERRSFGNTDRRDDSRGARPERGGERNSSYGDKKPFDKNSRLGQNAADRNRGRDRGRSDEADKAAEAPTYNLNRYKENPRIKKTNRTGEEEDGSIRLNRYIANAGVCSRREADVLIESGEIKVNGEVVIEMGHKVNPGDTVHYGKKLLSREKMVYVLLNKPKDFITTTDDPEGRKTVMDLVANASKERIFPVGRLDRNTTGLLLFTNDGELAQKLTHPSNDIKKIYQVELDKPITKEHFKQIAEGLELEDGKADVDDLALIGDTSRFLGVEIHIGRNRIVRRIFEHLGYDVVTLDRVQYAGLTKKDLPRGNWRFLNEKEVVRLKYFM
ncbi:pseudouridine synthase [Pontibacter qinzhouensis]|uniref:Pseudouridine synthase n=1 Tax=Pontibacter qinzhouensis TaxID=2603253 RepID=A0A5C8K9H5_9BACT|nr:pseudouridine synthase [Pontibacter qinzhouensis]TXK46737.1 pseudouridine synthase [Pontibacter qinzhouensis]